MDEYEKQDFQKIDLENKPKKFNGIPTGLFIAGFLSNISMFKVDFESSKIIEKEKNIAHFRFVDDHTFLSTDPEKLLLWVEEYKKILDTYFVDNKLQPCMQINWSKTKPDQCGEYLSKLINNQEENEKNKEMAITAMKLDPYYPSSLMNHTLQKMSMINSTPFDLLDPKEGDNLLKDIEHLLVTDFPEEEIRKDTRVAFAAARLANLTSRREYDFTSVYTKKITYFRVKDNEEEKWKKHNKGQYISSEKVSELEKDYNKTKLELEKNISNEKSKIFKLLVYAIRAHPDKLKLWKNTLLFCEKNGFAELDTRSSIYNNEILGLWDLIGELTKSKQLSSFSKDYIETYFTDVLSTSLIRVYKLFLGPPLSNREINRKCSYLNELLNSKLLEKLLGSNEDSYYHKQSKQLFKIILGTIIYLLKDLNTEIVNRLNIDNFKVLVNKFDLLNWEDSSLMYFKIKDIKFDHYIWTIVDKVSKKTTNDPLSIIPIYLSLTNLDNNYAYTVVSLYPNDITEDNTKKLLDQKKLSYFPFSWWCEVISDKKDLVPECVNIYAKQCFTYLNHMGNNAILNFKYDENDTSNKELTALKILQEILDQWEDTISLVDLLKLMNKKKYQKIMYSFPYNIFINTHRQIEIKRIKNLHIIDRRYLPKFIDFDKVDEEREFIFGIGILLFQLVTGEKKLPRFMYLPSNQLFNTNYFVSTLQQYPVSSHTVEIINSCLSKRKRETWKLKQSNDLHYDDDDSKDEFIIHNINSLKNAVDKAIEEIEKNQYMFSGSTRYLIPISLTGLKNNDLGIVEALDNE